MTPERRTLDTIDLPLPGNRALRLELYRRADGEPDTLVLALGWSDPDRFDRRESLMLPGNLPPELCAALKALDGMDPPIRAA